MATITIELTDEQMTKLSGVAGLLGLGVEETARLGVVQAVVADEEFIRTAQRILEKNSALYRRLA